MFDIIIQGYTLYDLVFYFFIYSFLGFLVDTAGAWASSKKLTYRGFLNGPICPIYGFGMLIVMLFLSGQTSYFNLFTGGLFIATTLEFTTSYVLEKAFHSRWWDYSNKKFNLEGRVCLSISIGWGLLIMVVMKYLNPFIAEQFHKIPHNAGKTIISIGLVLIVIDTILSILGALKIEEHLKEMAEDTIEEVKIVRSRIDKLFHKMGHRIEKAFHIDNKPSNK